jgi:hypothetical protein
MSFRVKIFTFYITSIFSASRGIFSASRCDLVRISLNFSTFNILSFTAVSGQKAAKSLHSVYSAELSDFEAFLKPPSPILQTTKRRPFHNH